MKELKKLAYKLRQDVVDMIVNGKGGHIGGDMSVMDTLVTLYFKEMNISVDNFNTKDHDHFIMSKGHSVEALYAVLAEKGFFPIERVLKEFSQFGSMFIGHPNNKLPGIEMNSGALGHGLPVAVGMAIAERMNKSKNRVYVVMGDGELAEGSVWEGAMSGATTDWTTYAQLLIETVYRFLDQLKMLWLQMIYTVSGIHLAGM